MRRRKRHTALMSTVFWGVFSLVKITQAQEIAPKDTLHLSLKNCVDMALLNNLRLKRSTLATQSSKLDMRAAYMNLLPSFNANANVANNWGRSIDPTTNDFVEQKVQSAGLGGSGNWILFGGFRNLRNMLRAQTDLKASQADLQVQRNLTIFSVVTLYSNVLLNQELLENAQYQQKNAQEQAQRIKKMVDAGSAAPVDLLNIRSQVANSQVEIVRAQNTLNFSVLTLKQALLIPYEQAIHVRDSSLVKLIAALPKTLHTRVEDIYGEALLKRPEIKSADLKVKSTELALSIHRGALSPTLSMNANLATSYSSLANRPRNILGAPRTQEVEIGYLRSNPSEKVLRSISAPEVVGQDPSFTLNEQFKANLRRSVGLSMYVPVFQRWTHRTNIQKAKLAYSSARIAAQEARNNLRTEIEQAYNDASAALQLYHAAEQKVQATAEAFRATEARYTLGTSHQTEYQIQSNSLYQARSELLRAKYTFAFRKKILDFYQGNLSY